VLFDPAKKQFHLLPFLINFSSLFRTKTGDIGQIDIGSFYPKVREVHSSEIYGMVGLGALDPDNVVQGDVCTLLSIILLLRNHKGLLENPSGRLWLASARV
jgi:hypothetical protein